MKTIVPAVVIEQKNLLVHGQKVMTDSDLADLYGVQTKILVQAVKRNISPFPPNFVFQLTPEEAVNLRSQIVASSSVYGLDPGWISRG